MSNAARQEVITDSELEALIDDIDEMVRMGLSIHATLFSVDERLWRGGVDGIRHGMVHWELESRPDRIALAQGDRPLVR